MRHLWIKLGNGDKKLFYLVNSKIRCSMLDKPMLLFSYLGGASFSILLCLMFLLGFKRWENLGIQAAGALVLGHLVVRCLKRSLTRPRPYLTLPRARSLGYLFRDHSFPSGHATASFSLATVLTAHFPGYDLLIYGLAALTGLSRMYLGQHYPSDVMAGALIGIFFGDFMAHLM